ncbi:MAG: hypothetical protein WC825_07935 [Gallionellaceae bacterium]|jgi:hypothetical protein
MDESEQLVEKYLLALNRGAVVFEPDGNIPPDFSLGGSIGVEVRRLNQNYERLDGSTEGLEELSIPLWQRLQKVLPTLGSSINGESWFVCIDFRRPVGPRKSLDADIKLALLSFMRNTPRTATTIKIAKNFEIDLLRAEKDLGSFFLLGASSDDDSGGWVMGEVEKNLRLCLSVKERKIAPHRDKYSEWWLVLTDHIDYSMDLGDREVFCAEVMPNIQHTFDKIILIDPCDYCRVFEAFPGRMDSNLS